MKKTVPCLDAVASVWQNYFIAPHQGGNNKTEEVIFMTTLTTAQAAEKLETTPRELRKFLRSITEKDSQPGKGSRWVLEARDVTKFKKQFADWQAARAEKVEEATPDS